MKKKILSLAVLVAAMLFTGCPMSLKKGIVGVWKVQDAPVDTFACFTSDGKMYTAVKNSGKLNRTEPVDYSINGNKLKIGDNEIECTI